MSRGENILDVTDVGITFKKYRKSESFKSIVHNAFTRDRERSETFRALNGITFSGVTGEVIGVIGSNGAGKTTLCRVLSKIYQPDNGEVAVNTEITAMLSLGAGFDEDLTGKDNVFINGMMLGFTRKQMKSLYPEIAEFADIGVFIDEPVRHYSSGMKSRLGFSIAAMVNPEVMVLDEALSTGDKRFSTRAGARIQKMVEDARLVIVVTHSLAFVRNNCDRAIWLEQGEVRKIGSPDEVVDAYEVLVRERKKNKRPRLLHLTDTDITATDVPAVVVDNVGVAFRVARKPFWAVRGVSFNVFEGEILGIIGRNGAGKSTLCRLIGGILKPDEGSVQVQGRTSALLGFGIGFNNELSGRENVFLNGMVLGIGKDRIAELFEEIVEFSELGDAIEKPVKYYSSGMRSRLGFSVTAGLSPDVLIIDEALAAGDAAFTEKASEKIQDIIAASKAVIVVTHKMQFVEQVCTRAIVIEDGGIGFDGDSREAVAFYTRAT